MKSLTREDVAQLQKDLEAVFQKNGLTLTKNSATYSPVENSVTFRLGAVKISKSKRGRSDVDNETIQNGFAPVGTRVEVLWSDGIWYAATILRHVNGTRFDYAVEFDEDGSRYKVRAKSCRKEEV